MKKTISNYFWIAIAFLILGKIFSVWFVSPKIIGGDWPTFYREFLAQQRIFPTLWSTYRGLGGAVTPVLNLETLQAFLIVPWVNWLGLPWEIVYKIGWFGLFLVLGIVSSLVLSRTFFIGLNRRWVQAMAVLFYLTNTYVLMLVSGGQMGVALAYALFPLVLAQFMQLGNYVLLEKKLVPIGILTAGLSLSLEIIFDLRFAYLVMVAVFLYWLFLVIGEPLHRNPFEKGTKLHLRMIAVSAAVPVILAALLNAFWLLPTVATASRTVSELGAIYTSSSAVPFFSFADFSHALSLLHPNWPENIFGKVYFLQPEFLVIPLIAFASLLFTGKRRFFALLGLVGVFLAKGANEPLGGVYLWLFDHVPGFVMFRDPTKWYVFIATSYAILVPAAVEMFTDFIQKKFVKKKVLSLVGFMTRLAVVILWIVLIRQALIGTLGGTLQIHDVPKEYTELANGIARQPDFFRTLWVPKQSRFSPVSDLHTSFASEFISSASTAAEFVERFDTSATQGYLEELAFKYVMIPYDVFGEIFLDDRHYDPKQRQEWERYLDTIKWLKKVSAGNITVYETTKHHDHFWLSDGTILGYRMQSPDRYEVTLATQTSVTLYFSERFHPGWQARFGNQIIAGKKTPSGLNSFVMPGGFTGDVQVFFYPEVYAVWGRIVSIVTLAGVAIFVILLLRKRRSL